MNSLRISFSVLGLSWLLVMACNRPIAKFMLDQDAVVAPSQVNFTNQSEKADYYEWDFGDGTQSTETSPSHRYIRSGSYQVILKAMSGTKIKKTDRMVKVNPPVDKLVEIQTT
ncbi:MAG: PKD domain-containing protein, partial [Saprospiraceae bacterium]|nr:PKD domain-containing protein [Saprospiraceae bacterium]